MTDWFHRCNPEWLKARCDYLSASDVAALWPETPTGRKRTVTEDDYLAAIFKSREFDPAAATSYGAAARGHILEPYAINEYNLHREGMIPVYHWDDCLIHNGGLVSFSPDGLDIQQPDGDEVEYLLEDLATIHRIIEVKSYGADKHYTTYKMGYKATERIQIATEMYVAYEARKGELVLYNPRLDDGCLLTIVWDRYQLAHELEIIDDIVGKFCQTVNMVEDDFIMPARMGPSEAEILAELRTLRL